MRRLCGLVIAVACNYNPARVGIGDNPDGGSDGSEIAIDGVEGCYGVLAPVCLQTVPSVPQVLTGTINTDNSLLCTATKLGIGDGYCVIAGTTVEVVSGTVRVEGSRPIVLVATQQITIGSGATLDLSTKRTGMPAAAARSSCDTGVTLPDSDVNGDGGGGWGGSYGGTGGPGGASSLGALGGTSGPAPGFTTLVGGCPGGAGARSGNPAVTVAGGGGGAVALIAPTITVSGVINASGASGTGGNDNPDAGGGGGGSGGAILLDTPNLDIGGAIVVAYGGGGGGGGCCGSSGDSGIDPTVSSPGIGGGGQVPDGGAGGNASSNGDGLPGLGATINANQGAGGGGGGGCGIIKTSDPSPSGAPVTVSPPVT